VYETTMAAGDYVSDNVYTVEKDDVEFVHVQGNDTVATKTASTWFILAVNDTDATTLVTEVAKVDLEVTLNNSDVWLVEEAEVETNATGYFEYEFFASCRYDPGEQRWRVKISDIDACYRSGYSEEWYVTLEMLCPEFNVTEVLAPREAFQYRMFGVNATLRVADRNATGTNVTIATPTWLAQPAFNQYLGKIIADVGEEVYRKVAWGINATDLSPYLDWWQLNITANATDEVLPIDYYEHTNATNVTVYELTTPALVEPTLPLVLESEEVAMAAWPCEAGMYRIANLSFEVESTYFVVDSSINTTELELNSTKGITQVEHWLSLTYYPANTYANLTIQYFNTTPTATSGVVLKY
jgi:hypothetical protein